MVGGFLAVLPGFGRFLTMGLKVSLKVTFGVVFVVWAAFRA